jgi:hypothetical protein
MKLSHLLLISLAYSVKATQGVLRSETSTTKDNRVSQVSEVLWCNDQSASNIY